LVWDSPACRSFAVVVRNRVQVGLSQALAVNIRQRFFFALYFPSLAECPYLLAR
jgi:hypothetical protein